MPFTWLIVFFCLRNKQKRWLFPGLGASSFPLLAKQTKAVAVPRAWGQPPFLSVLQTKAGRAGGAEQGRGQKKRKAASGIM